MMNLRWKGKDATLTGVNDETHWERSFIWIMKTSTYQHPPHVKDLNPFQVQKLPVYLFPFSELLVDLFQEKVHIRI